MLPQELKALVIYRLRIYAHRIAAQVARDAFAVSVLSRDALQLVCPLRSCCLLAVAPLLFHECCRVTFQKQSSVDAAVARGSVVFEAAPGESVSVTKQGDATMYTTVMLPSHLLLPPSYLLLCAW